MPIAITVLLGSLIKKVVDVLRYARAADWNGVTTQVIAWAAGIIGVLLVAQTDFASGVAVGDQTLATMNFASQLFVGLMASSLFSVVTDTIGALDTNDPTEPPPLVAPKVVNGRR